MNKKASERKPRVKKEENSLSTIFESVVKVNPKADLNQIITFYSPFKCKNKTQKDLINLINDKDIIIAAGPAGVGKSFVTVARALELLKSSSNKYTKIIVSKPAVEADEEHGFVPGTIREKMEPYIASTMDNFDDLIGKQNRLILEEAGYLEVQPLAFIRGKSIKNTILLMEEVQNMTPKQVKTLLTRIGENSKFILSGDIEQSDKFKHPRQSGLYDAIHRHKNIPEIGFIEFSEDEIVRHPLISKILANYKEKTDKPTPPETKILREGKNPEKKSTSILKKIFNFFK
jgi:phosphate starvation-inducible PhoH-like protein